MTASDTEPEEVDRFAVLLKRLSSERETGQHEVRKATLLRKIAGVETVSEGNIHVGVPYMVAALVTKLP